MIRHARLGGTLTVTLDRPAKANALTRDMLVRLAQLAEGAQDVPLFILTGRGRSFSAGADLKDAGAGLATDPVWERLSTAIAALPGLSIAALNGTLAGGAFGMALACDLRIAVPQAQFFYPVMRRGFLPQSSDPGRLSGLVGRSRAAMILLGGVRIDAEQALTWGLIDRIAPAEQLLETAQALGADALSADPAHIAAIKRMIPHG